MSLNESSISQVGIRDFGDSVVLDLSSSESAFSDTDVIWSDVDDDEDEDDVEVPKIE